MGVRVAVTASIFGSSRMLAARSVAMVPGAMALTRMPWSTSASATAACERRHGAL